MKSKRASLAILLLLTSCAPHDGFFDETATLQLEEAFEAQSFHLEQGEFTLQLEGSLPNERTASKGLEGQEYILVALSRNRPNYRSPSRHRLDIYSNIRSAPLPSKEQSIRANVEDSELQKPSLQNPILQGPSVELPEEASVKTHATLSQTNRNKLVAHETDHPEQHEFYIRATASPQDPGELRSFEKRATHRDVYEFYRDTDTRSGLEAQEEEQLLNCLDDALPKAIKTYGNPLNLYSHKRFDELKILLTPLRHLQQGNPIGLFNFLDFFLDYRGEAIPQSNFDNILYLSPHFSPSQLCSTTVHEFQHLINFLHKVVSQLPEESRTDLSSMVEHGLERERLFLDEGLSHVLEELSQQYQEVYTRVLHFLKQPHQTSMALETNWNDVENNFRTRGLGTLLIYHAIARANGRLHPEDENTKKLLQNLIQSPQTGLQNIASYFDETPREFLESFFKNMFRSFYQMDKVKSFIPPMEQFKEAQAGIKILDRQSLKEPEKREIHPLEMDIPLLRRTQSLSLEPEGLAVFHLRVPEDFDENLLKINFSTNQSRFYLFAIRVR